MTMQVLLTGLILVLDINFNGIGLDNRHWLNQGCRQEWQFSPAAVSAPFPFAAVFAAMLSCSE